MPISNIQQKNQKPSSRAHYEFTLAEFPVSLFSKKPSVQDSIEYQDMIEGKDGQPVERTWRVIPSAKYGFGGPTTISTMFELFQIWKDASFQERNINFGSVYNLIQRKFLKSVDKRVYDVIIRDLEALSHMTFDAINAFWDNEKKAYVDIHGFKLFDYLALYKDKPNSKQPSLPFSYIRVSEVLWDSANKQNFFPIGIKRELFHSLKPLEQRLALYLEKVFRSQSMHRRDAKALAEQLPIQSKAYKHTKLTLKRACDGLLEKGYSRLGRYTFEKAKTRKGENIVFFRAKTHKEEAEEKFPPMPENPDLQTRAELYVEEILEVCQDSQSKPYYIFLVKHILQSYQSVDLMYRVLGETKEAVREGWIKNSAGAFFVDKMKHYLEEDGKPLPVLKKGNVSVLRPEMRS